MNVSQTSSLPSCHIDLYLKLTTNLQQILFLNTDPLQICRPMRHRGIGAATRRRVGRATAFTMHARTPRANLYARTSFFLRTNFASASMSRSRAARFRISGGGNVIHQLPGTRTYRATVVYFGSQQVKERTTTSSSTTRAIRLCNEGSAQRGDRASPSKRRDSGTTAVCLGRRRG